MRNVILLLCVVLCWSSVSVSNAGGEAENVSMTVLEIKKEPVGPNVFKFDFDQLSVGIIEGQEDESVKVSSADNLFIKTDTEKSWYFSRAHKVVCVQKHTKCRGFTFNRVIRVLK